MMVTVTFTPLRLRQYAGAVRVETMRPKRGKL
jgi:hypothetical protein